MLVLMVTAVVGGNGEVRAQVQVHSGVVTEKVKRTDYGDWNHTNYARSAALYKTDGWFYVLDHNLKRVHAVKLSDGSLNNLYTVGFINNTTYFTGYSITIDNAKNMLMTSGAFGLTGRFQGATYYGSTKKNEYPSVASNTGGRIDYIATQFHKSMGDATGSYIAGATTNTTDNIAIWKVETNDVKSIDKAIILSGKRDGSFSTGADIYWINDNSMLTTAQGINPYIISDINFTNGHATSIKIGDGNFPSPAGGGAYFKLNNTPYIVVPKSTLGAVYIYNITTPSSPILVAETDNVGSVPNRSLHLSIGTHNIANNKQEIYIWAPNNGYAKHEFEAPLDRTFTVEVPQGTENVYIAGSFPGKNWDTSSGAYKLTQDPTNPRKFSTTIACLSNIEYKYLCNNTGDWDYQEASISNGNLTSNPNRTYNTSDVVTHWFASPKVTLNVSFASGVNTPDNLFVKGGWDSWAAGKAMTKSGDTYSITINEKTYANTEYKYYTNDPSNDNWETRSDGTNRWAIYPRMDDQITGFGTTIQARVQTPIFNPVGGTFNETRSKEVSISSSTEGATFYYTTDGSTPTTGSTVVSGGKITLSVAAFESKTFTVKVLATKSGMKNSDVATATFYVNAPQIQTKNFSVKVPTGTETVYLKGKFPNATGEEVTKTYQMTYNASTEKFEKTNVECFNSVTYNYYCDNPSTDSEYIEATDAHTIENDKPKSRDPRTYNASDEVKYWVAMPKVTLHVSIAEGIEDVENLYVKGGWDSWASERPLSKTAPRSFNITINQKTYSNLEFKFLTDSPSSPNWENNSNRWAIYPLMSITNVTFVTPIPAKNPPTITPTTQIHNAASVVVTITATAGDDIYYTLDGTNPKISSTKITYSGPFTIPTGNTLVWAYAVKNFKESAEAFKQYAISTGTTEEWNISSKNTSGYNNASDQGGIAISNDGKYIYKHLRTAPGIARYNASNGELNNATYSSGLPDNSGGDVTVCNKGDVFVSKASTFGGDTFKVVKFSGGTGAGTDIISATANSLIGDGSDGETRIGYGIGVWRDASSGTGYLIAHIAKTAKILLWKLKSDGTVDGSPSTITISLTGSNTKSIIDRYTRFSIIDETHFWLSGWDQNSLENPPSSTPIYCTISKTGANYTSISGERMLPTSSISPLTGGATEFSFKGKRYGVFAANSHGNTGIWSGMPNNYSILQEYKSTDTGATPTGPVIALFPPQGLGATKDDSHFVESVVRVESDTVLIYTMGGFNGTACYKFTDSKVNDLQAVYHFGQNEKTLNKEDLGLHADTDITLSNPSYATGTHNLSFTAREPGHFSTTKSTIINVGPYTWQGNNTANWGSTNQDWKINTYNQTTYPNQAENDVVIPATLPAGNKGYPTLQADVELNSLKIESGAKLTIDTESSLIVHDALTNQNGAAGIYVKADPTKSTGSLLFDRTKSGNVQATVELYSRGEWTVEGGKITNPKWQYFGIPFTEMTGIEHTFYGAIIREYNEPGAKKWVQLNNSSTLLPMKGYEIAQPSPKKYVLTGTLYTGDLNYTVTNTEGVSYAGQNIISNPYLAAIPVDEINFGTGDTMDKTVYVYNTGRLTEWTGGHANDGTNPGQYLSIPYKAAGAAGIPAEIAPMQGFLVRTNKDVTTAGSFAINYNQLVKNTAVQRAPKAAKPWLRLTLAAENSGDVMWLFAVDGTTPHYDNGWDGTKMGGDAGTPMLFSHNETGNYQINALDDIDDTDIAFRASNTDTQYTITFNHGGGIMDYYSKIYFEDKETGDIVDITEDGATYTFASSNQSITSRFRIATSPALQTGTYDVHIYTEGEKLYMNNISDTDSTIELIDLSGRNLTTYYCKAGEMKVVQLAVPRGCYVVRATTERVQSTKVVIK